MKKWRWHYLISILMIPVLLLVCVRIYKTPHAEDIEQLFLESDDDANCDIEALYRAVAEVRQTTTDELRKALITNYKRLIR